MKEWPEYNIQDFDFKLPMNKDFWILATELQDIFNTRAAKSVNPFGVQTEGSLSYQWWEWLAEVPETRTVEEFVKAARFFSWNYPQLKMVINDCRITKDEPEHNLDGIYFLVKFYK